MAPGIRGIAIGRNGSATAPPARDRATHLAADRASRPGPVIWDAAAERGTKLSNTFDPRNGTLQGHKVSDNGYGRQRTLADCFRRANSR